MILLKIKQIEIDFIMSYNQGMIKNNGKYLYCFLRSRKRA